MVLLTYLTFTGKHAIVTLNLHLSYYFYGQNCNPKRDREWKSLVNFMTHNFMSISTASEQTITCSKSPTETL